MHFNHRFVLSFHFCLVLELEGISIFAKDEVALKDPSEEANI